MANEIKSAFDSVYADGPSSGPTQPQKSRIRDEVGGTIQAQVDAAFAAAAGAAAGLIDGASWADLSTNPDKVGTRDGQPGRVPTADAGTHTGYYVNGSGSVVSGAGLKNSGEYLWSASLSAWVRTRDLPNIQIIQTTTGAADAAKPIGTNASGIMDISFLPSNLPVLRDEGLLFSVGDGVRALLGVSDDGKGTLTGPWPTKVSDLANCPDARPKVYLAGDSRSDQCSTDYSTEARGFLWWLQFLTGASFDFQVGQNYGVAGSETSELVGQSITIAGQEPGIVFNFTGTNDRTAGYTSETTIMNYETAEAVLTKAGGHRVIWINDTPRGDGNSQSFSGGLSGDNLGNHLRCAQWLRERGKGKGVYCADTWPSLINGADSVARAINTVFYDGLHPALPGGYLIAKAILPLLDFLVPRRNRLVVSNADLYSTANASGSLNTNPLMTGTSGTVGTNCTGQLATGYSAVAGAGLSAALSKVTDAAGIEWQQAVVTGTPSGAHDAGPPINVDPVSAVISFDIDVAKISTGDIVEATCAVEIDTGHSGLRGVPVYLVATAGGIDTVVCGGEPNMASNSSFPNLRMPDPGSKLSGVNITPQITIPASTTALKLKMVVAARGGEPINATVRFSRSAARKVISNG